MVSSGDVARSARIWTSSSTRSRFFAGPKAEEPRLARRFYAGSRLRGRPPFAPFNLAAAAFAFDLRRPPRRPVATANRRVPNARSTSPGTYTSTSMDRQDNASPAGETSMEWRAESGARSRPGMIRRGMDIDPPLRNARDGGVHAVAGPSCRRNETRRVADDHAARPNGPRTVRSP